MLVMRGFCRYLVASDAAAADVTELTLAKDGRRRDRETDKDRFFTLYALRYGREQQSWAADYNIIFKLHTCH